MTFARPPRWAVPLVLQLVGCGYRDVPPPNAPARTFPAVHMPEEPPEKGMTRVVLDANGERAMVTEVKAWTSSTGWVTDSSATLSIATEEERPVCIAPCAVTLPRGMHVLRFRSPSNARSSDALVQLDERPKVVRHAMGGIEKGSDGAAATAVTLVALGICAAMAGGLLLAPQHDEGHSAEEERQQMATALMIGGGAAVVFSVPIFLLARGTRQPGATTEFTF